MAYPDNLSKQKVSPALALFSNEMTTALKNEYGDEAKGTWAFLKMFNDYIIQPLLTVSTSKGLKVREAAVFISPNDVRLKCFKEISHWLQHDWYVSLRDLPDNKYDATEQKNDEKDKYCDAINYFMDEDEKEKISKSKSNNSNDTSKKGGRKCLIGGLSEETFFTLSHTLKCFSDLIIDLIIKKGFEFVLSGKIDNDPIELRFGINRYLAGNYLALDVLTFVHNERTLLLRLVSKLCQNKDHSHNKTMYKSFFENVQEMTANLEKKEVSILKSKWSNTKASALNNINSILKHDIIPYIAGYGVKKLMNRTPIYCIECLNTVSHGRNMTDNEKLFMEYNISYMELRDEGGLIWPSKIIVIMYGIIKIIFEEFLQSETLLNDYHHSCSSSRVALMTLKEIIFDIIKESSIFNDAIRTCNSCYTNRLKKISLPLVNTFFNVSTNNFTLLLNRREITKKITMKMVKDQKTKNRYVSENKCTNVGTDVSTWTCNYCKTFLKSYNAIQQGNVNVLRNRCYLLQKLISNNLQWIICLSMAELKQMSTRFSSPLGTKDEMVKNIYNIMVDTFSDTSSSIVECLDRDEGVDTDA